MNNQKVAIIGAGSAGLTLAWLCSSAGMETDLYERESDYTSSQAGQITYFFSAYHRLLAALYDYLGLYTEPRPLDYIYDYILKFETRDALFRNFSFNGLVPLAKRRLNADLEKLIRQALVPAAHRPKSIQLNQLMRGLTISSQSNNQPILSILGALWKYPQTEVGGLPAKECLDFLHSLLTNPDARCLYDGAKAYTQRLVFKGDWKFLPSRTIKKVQRNEDGTFVQPGNGKKHRYDRVILTCNLEETMRILTPLVGDEYSILRKMRYSHLPACIHSDESVFSEFIREAGRNKKYAFCITHYFIKQEPVFAYHYNMNLLENMPSDCWLSLNLPKTPEKVIWQGDRRCLGTDIATMQSIRQLEKVQGKGSVWHAGDYTGYHTSSFNGGILTALNLAKKMGLNIPFDST